MKSLATAYLYELGACETIGHQHRTTLFCLASGTCPSASHPLGAAGNRERTARTPAPRLTPFMSIRAGISGYQDGGPRKIERFRPFRPTPPFRTLELMTTTIIAAILLAWLGLGGIVALLIGPLLKERDLSLPVSHSKRGVRKKSVVRSVRQTGTGGS